MNVGFFLERLRIDGTVTVTLREAVWLKQHGYDVTVMGAAGMLRSSFDAAGIRVLLIPGTDPTVQTAKNDIDAMVLEVQSAIERFSIDALVCAASLPIAIALRAALVDTRVIYHVLSSDVFAPVDPATLDGLRDLAARGFVIAHSFHDAKSHAERYGFDVKDVLLAHLPIPCVVEDTALQRVRARAALGLRDDDVVVMTAARLDGDHVGYVLPFLHAVEDIAACERRVRAVVIGDGVHGEEVRSRAPGSATFLGYRTELATLYPAADIYVGEGSSMLEAAAWGVPTIIACAQAIPHLGDLAFAVLGVHTTQNQYWEPTKVAPPVDYRLALEPFVTDSDMRHRVGDAGRREIETGYSTEKYMSWLLRVARGERPASLIHPESVAAPHLVRLLDDASSTLARADAILQERPQSALHSDVPVPWARYLGLPDAAWRRLAAASRRAPNEQAPQTLLGASAP